MRYRCLLTRQANPLAISGSIIEAIMPKVTIGEICEIRSHWQSVDIVAYAQVLGFKCDNTILSLIGSAQGLSRDAVVHPTGEYQCIDVGDFLKGAIIGPRGDVVERILHLPESKRRERRRIDALPLTYQQRAGIAQVLTTGIRAIDGMLTCGIGQRVGIFAAAGGGKTTLMNMLIEQSEADIFVIGLIGERGREVTEFIEELRHSPRYDKCTVVYATSDFSALERCNAALTATTIAEYFRDQGKRVVLFLDSITRYARALRDVALATGEAPARRGYPASVFENLPRVLERPGNTLSGSITAFYTILLESENESDPVAEEIRSILDGHIYLSSKLAEKNHFPAIDILRSTSRVAGRICQKKHLESAAVVRGILSKLEELQIFIDLGEYTPGDNEENDRAIHKKLHIENWLRQDSSSGCDFNTMLSTLHELTSKTM